MCVVGGRGGGGAGLGYLVGPHSCAAVEAGARLGGGWGEWDHHCIARHHEWPIVRWLAVSASLLYSRRAKWRPSSRTTERR